MRRILALALLALAPALSAGCSSDAITDPGPEISGTYSLTSLNGTAPPVVVLAGDPQIELLSDEITFASGRFTQRGTFRVTEAGTPSEVALADAGTFSVRRDTLILTYTSDGSSVRATFASVDAFTVLEPGAAATYRRQ